MWDGTAVISAVKRFPHKFGDKKKEGMVERKSVFENESPLFRTCFDAVVENRTRD